MAGSSEMKILITGDAGSAMGVLSQFSNAVKDTAGKVEGHFSGISKVIDDLASPILKITALLGGGAMFKGAIDGTVELGKEVGGLQRLMGGTVQIASATRIAIRSVFGDVDSYEGAATRLVRTLNKNEAAVTSLGVKTRDSRGHFREMTDLLPEVVRAMGEFSAGTDRDAAAQAIFGRGFKEVLRYANMTPEVMAEATKKSREFGLELDQQSQGTIKAYRLAMVDIDEAMLGIKTNVGLKVMPTLTAFSNWFASIAPQAIETTGSLLRGVQDVLGNTTIQVALAGVALNSLISIFSNLAIKIPLISMAVQTFQMQMALAAMPVVNQFGVVVSQGVTGLTAMAGALRGTASAMLGMISPWMVAGAAIVGVGYGLSSWAQSYGKSAADMAEANLKAAETAVENARGFETQGKTLADLESKLKGTTAGSKAHKAAADQMRQAIRAMSDTYPEFLGFLKKENGSYVDLAGSVERFNKAKIRELEIMLDKEQMFADIARVQKVDAMGGGWSGIVGYGLVYKGIAENAEREQKAHEATAKAIQKQLDVLKGADASPSGKHWAGGDGKPKTNTYAEDMVRLQKQGLDSAQKTTLEEERLAEVKKLDLQREGDLLDIKAKLAKGEIQESQATDERRVVEQNYADARMGIWDAYAVKRKAMEEELQGKLTAAEEGGLEKRLEAIRASFVKIRNENLKLAQDGKKFYSDEAIQAAQDAEEAQAKKDQIQADLAKLKKELSELAQVSGGKLSESDKKDVLDRWKSGGGTKSDAAGIYEKESHFGEGAGAGIKAGIDGFIAQAYMAFETWRGFATSVLSSTEGAFANFFTSLTQRGQTFGEKTKALWQGISNAVVGGLAKIAAQHLITWGIEKAKLAWDAIRSAWSAGDTTKTVTENTTKSASNTSTAATGFFATFANMGPWGYAMAAAAIIAMLALLKGISGREHGGPVKAGTPYIVGEAGHELFVPKTDGTIIPHHALSSADGNLRANLGHHSDQISSLNSKAGSYAAAAFAQGGGRIPSKYEDYRGSTIITTDSRQWAEMVHAGNETWAKDI